MENTYEIGLHLRMRGEHMRLYVGVEGAESCWNDPHIEGIYIGDTTYHCENVWYNGITLVVGKTTKEGKELGKVLKKIPKVKGVDVAERSTELKDFLETTFLSLMDPTALKEWFMQRENNARDEGRLAQAKAIKKALFIKESKREQMWEDDYFEDRS